MSLQTIYHVRKKDLVQVMTGKEKGKTGKVLRVIHKHGRIVVEKLNMVKTHKKPTATSPGGIVEREGSFAASNVLPYCEKCQRGVRTARKVEGKKTVRVCAKCESQLEK